MKSWRAATPRPRLRRPSPPPESSRCATFDGGNGPVGDGEHRATCSLGKSCRDALGFDVDGLFEMMDAVGDFTGGGDGGSSDGGGDGGGD